MLPVAQLSAVLPTLPRITIHGLWSRAIGSHHLLTSPPQPLWSGGPPVNGARFTPKGGFDSIYLASDPFTALREVVGVFSHPGIPAFTLRIHPWTVLAIDGVLSEILDLTNSAIQGQIGTTLAELTGDWAYGQEQYSKGLGPIPPTQLLGQAAYDCGSVLGFRYLSAKNTRDAGIGIVVFTSRLPANQPSYLEVYDPHNKLSQRLP